MTEQPTSAHSDEAPLAAANKSSFAQQADQASPGIVQEFGHFLRENKKWWLIPIFIAVGLIAALVALSSSAIAPLIYPLF